MRLAVNNHKQLTTPKGSLWDKQYTTTKKRYITMYVLIHHKIKDTQAFWDILEREEKKPSRPPAGVNPFPVFYPTSDGKDAFCMYKADSLDDLRSHVDSGLGQSSENTYFVVNEEVAQGLPEH